MGTPIFDELRRQYREQTEAPAVTDPPSRPARSRRGRGQSAALRRAR